MKRYKKWIWILALVLAFAMLPTAAGLAAEEPDVEEIMRNQGPALMAHENMVLTFGMDANGMPLYPDDFGGTYLDNTDYQLVIQLVNPTEERKQEYIDMCQDAEVVKFEEVQYSWNYLCSFEQYIYELREAGFQVFLAYPDTKENIYYMQVATEDLQGAQEAFAEMTGGEQVPVVILGGGAPGVGYSGTAEEAPPSADAAADRGKNILAGVALLAVALVVLIVVPRLQKRRQGT